MSGAATELASLLRQLHADTEAFHKLLLQESRQLQTWPLPDPWPLHTDKLRFMQALESGHGSLAKLLQQQGLQPGNATDAHTLISTVLGAGALAGWQRTLDLLAECQHLNTANGQSTEQLQQSVQQSLDLLRSALDQSATYGRQGTREHERRRASLGQA